MLNPSLPSLHPLDEIPIDPGIAALPKADLHIHQEWAPRLERVIATRAGRAPFDWRGHLRQILATTPPGFGRLGRIFTLDAALPLAGVSEADPETAIAVWADLLAEGAAAGARLIEVRVGVTRQALARPDFMDLFREAERRVQARYPHVHAAAIGYLGLAPDPALLAGSEQQLEICLQAAHSGLAGVDFRVDPYDTEADPQLWAIANRWASQALDAGLGITVHAGEFSPANLEAALRLPGLQRIGHAVYAAGVPHLLEAISRRGITVECCLSCNVISGAVPSYEAHPLRQLVTHGIPVTLNTDDPIRVWTTIGREYAIAHALGFTPAELISFTRNAIRASFIGSDRQSALLAELRAWEESQGWNPSTI